MAAVEKRKSPWTAILVNHVSIAFISAFIVLPISGVMKTIFGVFMVMLYYMGIHDFSLREGREHIKEYNNITPNLKYPVMHALIATLYLWIPPIIGYLVSYLNLFLEKNIADGAALITRIICMALDSPFFFVNLFYVKSGTMQFMMNFLALGIFTLLMFVSTISGYYLGTHNNSIAKMTNKLIYPNGRKKKQKQTKR